MPTDEQRLQRLYDYTKFHIGIYLLVAGALVTILGSQKAEVIVGGLTDEPAWLWAAVGAMAFAGMCGGVIASFCASAASFKEVWDDKTGPWYFPSCRGGAGR